jgi:hypothetical protein
MSWWMLVVYAATYKTSQSAESQHYDNAIVSDHGLWSGQDGEIYRLARQNTIVWTPPSTIALRHGYTESVDCIFPIVHVLIYVRILRSGNAE